MDDRGKAPAVGGEGSEADLAAFVRSMKDRPRDDVPPSGPGESSTVMALPEFPQELSYTVVTERRSHPIRSVPPPEPMTLPGHSGDEVNFFTLLSSTLHSFCADISLFSGGFCEGGRPQVLILPRVEQLCFLDLRGARSR